MDRRAFLGMGVLLAGCGGSAPPPAVEEPAAEAPAPEASFIPADFTPPTEVEGDGFVLVPLDTKVTEMDYKAYMASIEHLQKTFTHSDRWPREGLTMDDAVKDMENEQAQWEKRESFPYSVLDPEKTRERGCFYIRPSKKEGYDAVVRSWVTAEEFAAGFDEKLYEWGRTWVESTWPFKKVAYLGREISREDWDKLPDKT
ncbi:MAG: twin-arginine translocation pathway signal protein [Bryobacterales bacterium]|nr:twin-arginine translocation pathway signal protein [Acidobacteriota bacterium]MCB9383598.1 twin-arginine translocation pathway signal protein [Bryobacterales bacterium]